MGTVFWQTWGVWGLCLRLCASVYMQFASLVFANEEPPLSTGSMMGYFNFSILNESGLVRWLGTTLGPFSCERRKEEVGIISSRRFAHTVASWLPFCGKPLFFLRETPYPAP